MTPEAAKQRYRAAVAYKDRVAYGDDYDHPCQYGHRACATVDGGMCADKRMESAIQALARAGVDPNDVDRIRKSVQATEGAR